MTKYYQMATPAESTPEQKEYVAQLRQKEAEALRVSMEEKEAAIKAMPRDLLDPSINIDDLTPEQIHERILQFIGVEPPRPKTYLVLVALDVPQEGDGAKIKRKDGSESLLYVPEKTKEKLVFSSCTGMVIAMGPDAYKDPNRFPSGPACKLGEWVTIPRHEGVQIRYRGIAMHWLPDDKIALGIDDPSYVVRG